VTADHEPFVDSFFESDFASGFVETAGLDSDDFVSEGLESEGFDSDSPFGAEVPDLPALVPRA